MMPRYKTQLYDPIDVSPRQYYPGTQFAATPTPSVAIIIHAKSPSKKQFTIPSLDNNSHCEDNLENFLVYFQKYPHNKSDR
jgi:hypothetical protein